MISTCFHCHIYPANCICVHTPHLPSSLDELSVLHLWRAFPLLHSPHPLSATQGCFAHTGPRRKDRRGAGWEEWFHPIHLHPTWLTIHLGEHGVVKLIEIGERINWEFPLGQVSQKAPGRGRQGPAEDCLTHGVKPEREWMTTLGTSYRDIQGKGWLSLSLWMGSGIVVRTQMNRSCHTGPSTPKSWW